MCASSRTTLLFQYALHLSIMASSSVNRADRRSRLTSPGPPLFPSLEDTSPLPITHLNNITTYFSDWKADRRHARRPQPPTPTRMATKSRSASTAIPGPASGTSRRLTSMQKTNKSCLTPLLSPEKARRPSTLRRSIGAGTDFPPSSYHLPRSLLPRSESLLTDFENDQTFERAFDSRKFPHNKQPGLPKSQTTPALFSPNKDIASHSLLKPIGPPLPRSSTYNDISAARRYSNSPEKIQSGTVRVCFDGVRMPERPDTHISRIKSPYPQASTVPLPKTAQVQNSTSKPPPCTTDGSVSHYVQIPCNPETDPRFVYTYELTSYWTGRYVALLDRLRTGRFISSPSSKKSFARMNTPWKRNPKPKDGTELSRVELNIEKEAMKILRSFCQTGTALQSFEQFEYLIRKGHLESIRRSETIESRGSADINIKEAKIIPNSQSVAVLDDSKTDRWVMSGTLPRRMLRKASLTLQQQPKVQKSATVGNLCNPQFYVGSNSSSEGSEGAQKSTKRNASAVASPNFNSCRPKTHALSEDSDRLLRVPLNSPPKSRMNIEAARNFSHRDAKQTVSLVDDGTSLRKVSMKSTEETSFSAIEPVPMDSSRRFRKSESIKNLVDYGIKEVKKMGKRRVTSGTTADG